LGDFAQIVRLGEGVNQTKRLNPRAMDRAIECLKVYAEHVRAAGLEPSRVICVATSQARDAQNSEEFFARVTQVTGFCFQILTGDAEAAASFRGALLPGMDPDQSVVIDIGGGSTEIVSAQGGQSLNIGAVRFTEQFFKSDPVTPVTDEEFWACQEAIDQAIHASMKAGAMKKILKSAGTQSLIAVAGTATTLAAWYLQMQAFQADRIDGLVLQRGDVHRAVEEFKWRSTTERKLLPGVDPLRADVILAGALILWRVLEILNFSSCVVSTRGLRYGVLLSGVI
jgi:exopolyphosphatase/guanosine-5'-triphosphate,3'-diphosphate pyrophosphatase